MSYKHKVRSLLRSVERREVRHNINSLKGKGLTEEFRSWNRIIAIKRDFSSHLLKTADKIISYFGTLFRMGY